MQQIQSCIGSAATWVEKVVILMSHRADFFFSSRHGKNSHGLSFPSRAYRSPMLSSSPTWQLNARRSGRKLPNTSQRKKKGGGSEKACRPSNMLLNYFEHHGRANLLRFYWLCFFFHSPPIVITHCQIKLEPLNGARRDKSAEGLKHLWPCSRSSGRAEMKTEIERERRMRRK